MNYKLFQVPPGKTISLQKDYDPAYLPKGLDKLQGEKLLQAGIDRLSQLQNVLYAQNTYSILIIFQAMDAAGKDSTIKYVMSGVNPQGCQVYNFKTPSDEDLDHDYLWRYSRCLPERGRIGIFNRSYYEEVLIARVHPEVLDRQQLPMIPKGEKLWPQRFREINQFEQYLTNNGVVILKFFLNVSKAEQKRRFLKRIDTPEKNWKFAPSDLAERQYWDEYQRSYEAVFNHTSTEVAPWYVVPADRKWYTRFLVADMINQRLEGLGLKYPTVSKEHLAFCRRRG
ncbi:MAG: polyphosphate kinase 2 family protein [Alkalinema sp. RU_4_3]|nr:polyphosphate kinase 2 family protein [Alkalinema sp. RU_4_3]